jgi:hypothetical protein
MKTIDLMNMTTEDTIELNRIAESFTKSYIEFVDEESKKYGDEMSWWLTSFATRNSLQGYEKLCKYLLVKQYIKNSTEPTMVVVDDIGIYKALKNDVRKSNNVTLVRTRKKIKDLEIVRFIAFFGLWWKKVRKSIYIKRHIKKYLDRGSVIDTLIDTYVMNSCFKEDGYHDRYFNGILDNTNRKLMFSTILLHNMKTKLLEFVEDINHEDNYDFIVKEKYLKWWDYCSMLAFPFACIKYMSNKYVFQNDDISQILRRSFIGDLTSENVLDGYMAYNFVKRLYKRKIKINNCILWYEGQASSLGFIQGMRKYYKDVKVKGYIGISMMEYDLELYPSAYQVEKKIAPDVIGVTGKGMVSSAKRFCNSLPVEIFPSFRFHRTTICNNRKVTNSYRVLLVLPYYTEVSAKLIEDVLKATERYPNMKFDIQAKNHPNNDKCVIGDYTKKAENKIQIVTGDVAELMGKADIVINSMSSSSMETIANGIFLITYIPCGQLENVGIPDSVDKCKYVIAYNSDDICRGIEAKFNYINVDNEFDSDYYYRNVSKESVKQMLD